jgi:hypothetical protein
MLLVRGRIISQIPTLEIVNSFMFRLFAVIGNSCISISFACQFTPYERHVAKYGNLFLLKFIRQPEFQDKIAQHILLQESLKNSF